MKINLIQIITYEYLNELINIHIQYIYIYIYIYIVTNNFNELGVNDFTHGEITLG